MPTEKSPSGIAPDNHDLELLARGEHHDPHSVLGAHPHSDGTVLRALRPNAESVSAVIGGKTFPLEHVSNGIFAALVPYPDLIDYRYSVTYQGGHTVLAADPYRFLPTLGNSTFTCSAKVGTNDCGTSSAHIRVRTRHRTDPSTAPRSPSGLRPPAA